jgi:asparagine synthase (glutamine-hydrolysing)
MCGIAGFINLEKQMIAEKHLDQMLQLQYHRGPDFQGKSYCGQVGFAHNRLSLLDLSSAGHQPFADENHILVFNGEIYNFQELRKELTPKTYASSSDTAVLFQALKEWGVAHTLKKIKGMFAFSWYNKQTDEFYLVRDRLGIKPLFYGVDQNQTRWFASEVKALLDVMPAQANAYKVLFSSLGVLERSRTHTAWENIKQLEPGTFLKVVGKQLEIKTYYHVFDTVNEKDYQRLNNSSLHEVVAEFGHIFQKSVQAMCVTDAPLGSYVSGGLDSSIITWQACHEVDQMKLFTANILGKHSEFKDAKSFAQSINQPLFDYPFEKQMALRDWAKTTWHYESPIVVHFNAIPFAQVSKLAHEHQIKAVLTGEGSDQLFLGYANLLTKRYQPLLKAPYIIFDKIYHKIPKLKGFLTDTGGSQDLMGLFRKGAQNYTNEIFAQQGQKVYDFVNKDKRAEHLETAIMLNEHLLSLLWRNDRMGMMHAIESRFPFLDEDMLAFAMNLPTKFKIGPSAKFYSYKHPFLIDKYIVRKYAEDKLPKALVYKNKNGFPMVGLRHIHVNPAFFKGGTIMHLMQMSFDQFKFMAASNDNYLTSLLASVEIWAKLFIERQSVEQVIEQIQQHMIIK